MDKYVTAIEAAGFGTFCDYPHVHISGDGHQVAVMRVNAFEVFEWGWVEADNGRSDFWEWAAWWKALRKVKQA